MSESAKENHSTVVPSRFSHEVVDPELEAAIQARAAEVLSRRVDWDTAVPANKTAGRWFWHGYIGPGKLTLMTSQWKAGKTTLLSIVLARMEKGGELGGLPVTACRAAVICEEGRDEWRERREKLKLGKHVSFFPQLFRSVPTMLDWQALVRAMLILREQEGLDLVILDPLATSLPGGNENSGPAMMRYLLCLREMTSQGMAVVLLHHPKKGATLPGQAARGSGVLPAYADIIVEKDWYAKPDELDRRRWLRSYSRYEATPRHLVLELNLEGTDYSVHETREAPESSVSANVLRMVFEDAEEKLTQKMILTQWPQDFPKPDVATISRLLRGWVQQGVIRQCGTGRRNEPYRYWLPGREEDLDPGENASPEERDR